MSEFKLKNIIPTASDAKGLFSCNGMYFPSNTNLFKMNKNEFVLVSSCDGLIKHFSVNKDCSILCTEDRIYLNHFQQFVGSLKRSVTAVDSCDTFFAVGNNNVLEIWLFPTEYKFCLFYLQSKHVGHHNPITLIKIIDDCQVLTASEDCTVRLFNIRENTSRVVAILCDIPIGLQIRDNEVTITVRNGSVVIVDINTNEIKNLKFAGEIRSSSSYNDITALSIVNMVVEENTGDIDILPTKVTKPKKKTLSKTTTLVLLQNSEEIFRCEVDPIINEISLENGILYVKTNEFVGAFDIQTETFTNVLSLPTIINISVFKNMLAAACIDKTVRIYKENTCIATLHDPKASGDIITTHISSSICTVVYSSGHVSCFNINDTQCFRSFLITDEPFSIVSASCVSEDGCFLFIAENATVKIIDLIKGKLLDTITLKSPIIKIAYYKDYLYTLEFEKILTKHSVFLGVSDNIILEDFPIGLAIKNSSIFISTIKEVITYDLNLNYLDSFNVQLESRNRSEMFIKNKPVECLDFTSSHVFCGGQSNSLKIFEYSCNAKKKFLVKNLLTQIISISRNKDLDNYKSKLYKEKDTNYNKNNSIEVKNIFSVDDKLYIQTKEDVCIYEKVDMSFIPIEFDILPTEEYIKTNLDNPLKSLIAVIKLNDSLFIKTVVDQCANIDFTIQYLPYRYAVLLLPFVYESLKQDFTDLKLLEVLNKLIFYHKINTAGLLESLTAGVTPLYSTVKKNKYLLEAIIKK